MNRIFFQESLYVVIVFTVLLLVLNCNHLNNRKLNDFYKSKEVNKIDIYCWCFDLLSPTEKFERAQKVEDNEIITLDYNICLTPINRNALDILKPKYLKHSISNRKEVKKFKSEILSKVSDFNGIMEETNARLVFLINYENDSKDTLIYMNKNNMVLNNRLFTYSVNIDSLLPLTVDSFDFSCSY